MTNENYLALIGDLRGSRQAADREVLQERLEAALERVNRRCAAELTASLTVTLGDEFQGLIRRPGAAIELIGHLEAELAGTPIRYGLGWGSLATRLREQAIGMDGPCFHRAREALEAARRQERWIVVRGLAADDERIIDAILALMAGVRERWKPKQVETVALMRHSRLQRDVAARRGVVESVVSDTLRAALYWPMIAVEESVAALLDRFSGFEPSAPRGERPEAP
jgi:hypothetical protein